MENLESIWDETVSQLKDNLPALHRRALDSIVPIKADGNVITLSISSKFMLDNIKEHKKTIENTISEKSGTEYTVEFVVDNERKTTASSGAKKDSKKDVKIASKSLKTSKNDTLNPKYTFDNFISGDNSILPYQAAKVIAQNPGVSYNPCLIYGGVGLGKTHLLQAIGNYVDQHEPNKHVLYVTAEAFTNEFIASIANKTSSQFKQKYRGADVLLIDDIHFLMKKESTQEELFHTFNELFEHNKQIVFTCDRPITELTDITDRLRTRFQRGFNVDLRPPLYEVRMAIARQKIKDLNLSIPNDTLDYICQSVNTNVRDLEGALITVSGVSKLIGKPATIEIAKEQLKNIIVNPVIKNKDYTIDDIFRATANYFNISLTEIKGSSRGKNVKNANKIAIYIAYEYGDFTQTDIGAYIDRDHTSIRYSYNIIASNIDVDDSIKTAVNEIKNTLDNRN